VRLPLALVLVALPSAALANGAFPDTAQVLLPADRPATIVLGTNFGLIISDDGGGHWRWTCEHGDGAAGYRYAFSVDQRRLVGLAGRAIIVSEDLGCTWRGVGAAGIPFDFFPDGADPALALALGEDIASRIDAISRVDLGEASGAPRVLYQAPTDEQLTTVESARTDPRVIYATLNPATSSGRTRLVHSTDGGQSWATDAIDAPPDAADLRIAAVDPRDPLKIYFRSGTGLGQGEALLESDDGGKTTHSTFSTATGALAAFLPLADGALLSVLDLGVGRLYRWDGAAFIEVPAHLSARGFAERGGLIYAATDNVADGFAVARSRDRGVTWERVMGFGDISGISACGDLPGVCTGTCSMLAMRGTVPPSVCSTVVAVTVDAGSDASPDAAAADAGAADAGVPAGGGGCSCRVGSTASATTTTSASFLLWLLVRRRRGGRGPCGTAFGPGSRRREGRG
jgi:hypothetical protein